MRRGFSRGEQCAGEVGRNQPELHTEHLPPAPSTHTILSLAFSAAPPLVASSVSGFLLPAAAQLAPVFAHAKSRGARPLQLLAAMNTAFVFIKPHAVNDAVVALAKEHLAAAGCKVVLEGVLSAETIAERGIIDDHYAALAANAVKLSPSQLLVGEKNKAGFEEAFGQTWHSAASSSKVMNLADFRAKFPDMSVLEIEKRWRAGKTVKLAPGTYVSMLEKEKVMVVNGFYGSMREKFVAPGVSVAWMVAEFDESAVPWSKFRTEVIGATDPTAAEKGSLRRKIMEGWKALGLGFEPSTSDNGVHASAGPVEGMRERMIWLSSKVAEDPFGKQMLAAGVKPDMIDALCANSLIRVGDKSGPAFDVFEEVDSSAALQDILELQK